MVAQDILKLKSELNERGVESDDSVWHALGEDYASELNDAQVRSVSSRDNTILVYTLVMWLICAFLRRVWGGG